MVVLLSMGGFFEFYDLFFTAYVAPGLVRDHILAPVPPVMNAGVFAFLTSLFNTSSIASFVASLFAGLFVGTLLFGFVADRFGRRSIFTVSLLWYAASSAVMAFQTDAFGLNLWRFIAGIGIGVELVTIDTYLSELVPKSVRGRAFAINQTIQFAVVPVVAYLSYRLVPLTPYGWSGWRWVVLIGSASAIVVWFIRRAVPESPRWLASHGREAEADRVVSACWSARSRRNTAGTLPAVGTSGAGDAPGQPRRGIPAALRQPDGDADHLQHLPDGGLLRVRQLGADPADQAGHHHDLVAAVHLHHRHRRPLRAACCHRGDRRPGGTQMADRHRGGLHRGLRPAVQPVRRRRPADRLRGRPDARVEHHVVWRSTRTRRSCIPTRIRAVAVGFVYSFSRVSVVFSGFLIEFFLNEFGTIGVFTFIAGSMLVVMAAIATGPAVNNRALEAISH